MVCNVEVSKQELAKIDEKIRQFAVAPVAEAGNAPVAPDSKLVPRIRREAAAIRREADLIIKEITDNIAKTRAHGASHARDWAYAGMDPDGPDRASIDFNDKLVAALEKRINLVVVARDNRLKRLPPISTHRTKPTEQELAEIGAAYLANKAAQEAGAR